MDLLSDQSQWESSEIIRLDQLIQVHAKQFRGNTQVATEVKVMRHSNKMVLVIRILIH